MVKKGSCYSFRVVHYGLNIESKCFSLSYIYVRVIDK